MKLKKLAAAIALLCSMTAMAGDNLPTTNLVGTVQGNTANQFSTYTFQFTAATTGVDYFGFAFRQDPAYWTFGNASVTIAGTNRNLLSNGSMLNGGSAQINTSNYGNMYISAPTNWGVWYQSGIYPSAAGSWYSPGTGWNGSIAAGSNTLGVNNSTAGSWIDGAVGSFDGIYQGIRVTSGTTYNIQFDALSNNAVDDRAIQLGIYAGACASGTTGPDCMVSGSFTTVSTPLDGQALFNPSLPTPSLDPVDLPFTPTDSSSSTPTPPAPSGPVAVNNPSGTTATNPSGTTTLDVTNAGTYTNNGTNGDVTNSGTFTNNGTTGAVTNQTAGTFTNSSTGTTGNVTNSGTFTNAGTTGTVDNSGTFTNDGTTTTVTNSGIFTNNATTGVVTNTGGFTNSTGATTGAFTNNSAAVNSGTTGDVTNTGTFGNNLTGTTGAVTNSGTFLNSGTVTTVTNNGTFTNGGLAGAVNNLNVFNNTGTTGAVTNSGTFTNAGATGDVVNSGTFTNTGTLTSINNQGGFNTRGAGNTVNLTNYTQSSGASTLINGGQKVVVSGTANLNGDLTVLNAPTAYGNYTYLTAGTLNGEYSSLTLNPDLYPLGYGLVYTGNDVKLKVTPSNIFTQAGVTNNANSLSSVNNMIMGTMNGALGYDCSIIGEKDMCFSTGVYGIGSDGTKLGGVYAVLGRQVTDRVRAGLVVDKTLNKISVGNVSATNNTPSLGGYINWNMNPDGQGLALRASGSVTSNNVTVNRDSTPYSEAAQGKTSANGYAYQLKASYTTMPTSQRFNVTPYIGVRRSSLAINGFTETGAQYPISYNSLTQSTTDVLAGASMSYDFNDKIAGFVSAGMIKNLNYSAGAISGTSDIIGLSTVNSKLPAQGYTSPTVGAGLSYDLAKNQVVTVSTGWQQKTLTNTSQISGAVNYTVGF